MSNAQRRRAAKPAKARALPASSGVVVAYIHPGEVSAYFLESMLTTVLSDIAADAAGVHPRRIVNIMQEWSSANVSGSRNAVTERFLSRPEGEWLLWIDADMQWEPDAIERLLAVADPTERPIVGGLCFGMAGERMWPTIYQWAQLDTGLTTVRVGSYPADTVLRCAATGAAFVLIHRTALETIRARGFSAAFPWFQETELEGKPVGEDITFCIRAGLCGLPVYVHTGVEIGHHKSHLLTQAGFLAQPARAADVPAAPARRASGPERPVEQATRAPGEKSAARRLVEQR